MTIPKIPKDNTDRNKSLHTEHIAFDRNYFISILSSFLVCSLFFYTLKSQSCLALPKAKTSIAVSKLISTVNAFYTFFFAWSYVEKRIHIKTWSRLLNFSIGYLLFDMAKDLFFEHKYSFEAITQTYIHHSVVILIIVLGFNQYNILIARGLLAEITLPILNTGWFLVKSGLQDTLFAKLVGLYLIIILSVMRVYNFSKIFLDVYHTYKQKRSPFWHLMLWGTIVMLNYYWFGLILKKILYGLLYKIEVV